MSDKKHGTGSLDVPAGLHDLPPSLSSDSDASAILNEDLSWLDGNDHEESEAAAIVRPSTKKRKGDQTPNVKAEHKKKQGKTSKRAKKKRKCKRK